MTTRTDPDTLLEQVGANARRAGVFGAVRTEGGRLVCAAAASAEPADYRVSVEPSGRVWVELVTANRWLSESIETDLVHTGDKLNELLDEELADLGSAVPEPTAEAVTTWLLAYEQCFRQLGDMDDSGED
jgi:hypothetical protein